MAGQHRGIGENNFIPDTAIMRNMAVGHEPVVVPHPRDALILRRPTIDRAVFTNCISRPYFEACCLPCVFLVLRVVTDRGK